MKNYKFFLTLFCATTLFIGCSKDDGDGGGGKTGSAPDGVPTGEIVPVEQRNKVLTGFNEVNGQARPAGANQEESQVWWRYSEGKISSDDCPEYNQILEDGYWIAWTPDGRIVYKYEWDDEPFGNKTYEWINEDKTGLILNGQSEIEFSRLNENGLTYWSTQGNEICEVLTYESMGEPQVE